MVVQGRGVRGLFGFIVIGALFFIINKTAFAEETPQGGIHPFRLGVGVGIPYGGFGLNLSYRFNDWVEASGGYGTRRNGFEGWAIGGRIYPFAGLTRFRPRLAAFYGVVGTVTSNNGTSINKTIDVFEGFALGGGFEWKFARRHSLDFDIFYTIGEPPEKYQTSGNRHRVVSLGYGYHF
jgi:hypothetical protein